MSDSTEIIARAVIEINEVMKKLSAAGLNRGAIVTLLNECGTMTKRDINLCRRVAVKG